jgi:hypothetical protein
VKSDLQYLDKMKYLSIAIVSAIALQGQAAPFARPQTDLSRQDPPVSAPGFIFGAYGPVAKPAISPPVAPVKRDDPPVVAPVQIFRADATTTGYPNQDPVARPVHIFEGDALSSTGLFARSLLADPPAAELPTQDLPVAAPAAILRDDPPVSEPVFVARQDPCAKDPVTKPAGVARQEPWSRVTEPVAKDV